MKVVLLVLAATIALFLFLPSILSAAVLTVPDDYGTVQSAIDATQSGDTVLIRTGAYWEILVIPDRDVSLCGQYIFSGDTALIDSCVLHPAEPQFRNIFAPDSTPYRELNITGLRIAGGAYPLTGSGGGIFCFNRHLKIRRSIIDSCLSEMGGAIHATRCFVDIADSRIRFIGANNGCSGSGALLYLLGDSARIVRTEIAHSWSMDSSVTPDIIYADSSHVIVRDCSVHDLGQTTDWGHDLISVYRGIGPNEIVNNLFIHNRFHTGISHLSTALASIAFRFDSNLVQDNEFQSNLYSTDYALGPAQLYFRYNTFDQNSEPSSPNVNGSMFFSIGRPGPYIPTTISNNLFTHNHSDEYSCMTVGDPLPAITHIEHNYILDNSVDALMFPPGGVVRLLGTQAGVFRHNIIVGNRGYAVFHSNYGDIPAGDASENYWGHASGPYQRSTNPFGAGDTVDTLISYTPWMVDTTALNAPETVVPAASEFLIGSAYPNPFNARVTIEFAVTETRSMRLEIFDLLGRQVAMLESGLKPVGIYRTTWDANGFSSGIYFARLSAEGSTQRPWLQKLVLLK